MTTLEEAKAIQIKIAQFSSYIKDASLSFGVEEPIIKGIIWRESSGDQDAMTWENPTLGYSWGLMGVTYGAATDSRLPCKPYVGKPEGLLDPETNIWYGTAYLKLQLVEYNGDIKKALSAYNAGHYTTGNLETYVNKVLLYKSLFEATRPTLKRGSTGEAVIDLQTRLGILGYYTGKIDGIFGFVTESAVKSFQSDQGLAIDGIVGDTTWFTLDKRISIVKVEEVEEVREAEKGFPLWLLGLGLLLLTMIESKK